MTGAFYDDSNWKYGNSLRHYDEQPLGPVDDPFALLLEDGASYLLLENGGHLLLESSVTQTLVDYTRALWRFDVAWTSGLIYGSDANGRTEVDRVVGVSFTVGRPTLVSYNGQGFSRWTPGRMVVTLTNDDGRYDPNNAASPLYPNVAPNKFCRLGVRGPLDDYCNWRFTGYIVDVKCYIDPIDKAAYADLIIADGWAFLQGKTAYLPVYPANTATMSLILDPLLRAAGWPWGFTTDGGFATFPWYWSGSQDVYSHLHELSAAQGDRIWLDGAGLLHTEKRTAADSLVANITQANTLVDIQRTNPWDNLWNVVKVNMGTFLDIIGAAGYQPPAWGDDPNFTKVTTETVIPANGSIVISGQYSDNGTVITGVSQNRTFLFARESASSGIFPMFFDGDWWTGSGGTGVKLTGSVVVDVFYNAGDSFKAVLLNKANVPLYSSNMIVRGLVDSRTTGADLNFQDDRSNGATQKIFKITSAYLQGILYLNGPALAKYYADVVAVQYPLVKFSMEGRPYNQYLHVQDRINVNLPNYSFLSDLRVGQLDERWLEKNGQAVRTTVTTEPYVVATG